MDGSGSILAAELKVGRLQSRGADEVSEKDVFSLFIERR